VVCKLKCCLLLKHFNRKFTNFQKEIFAKHIFIFGSFSDMIYYYLQGDLYDIYSVLFQLFIRIFTCEYFAFRLQLLKFKLYLIQLKFI